VEVHDKKKNVADRRIKKEKTVKFLNFDEI
jgi:hypothetical protein